MRPPRTTSPRATTNAGAAVRMAATAARAPSTKKGRTRSPTAGRIACSPSTAARRSATVCLSPPLCLPPRTAATSAQSRRSTGGSMAAQGITW